jgi:pimeloyl-ACP methyl ester carboxylesterase
MNYVDVFFESDDGLRLYARDYPGPSATSPVVLCLPGLTRNSKDFDGLAAALCAQYRVICPDQRGRGRSQRDKDPLNYRPDRYVQDMRTLLDHLRVNQTHIIGTSLGGLMAILMMATYPERILSLVLNDVGPIVEAAGLQRIASYVGKSAPVETWDDAINQTAMVNGVAFPDYTRADWQSMAHDVYIQKSGRPVLDYDPGIAVGIAAGTATTNLWPLFKAMPSRPLLVVRGESSDILSNETMVEMTRSLPDATAVTIPKRGHAPTLNEREAREAISSFLTRVAAAAG